MILATRTTLDGLPVEAHDDGRLSFRDRYVLGGGLPREALWTALDDVCLYTAAELPRLVKAAKEAYLRRTGAVARVAMRKIANGCSPAPLRNAKPTGRPCNAAEWKEHVYRCRAPRCRFCGLGAS